MQANAKRIPVPVRLVAILGFLLAAAGCGSMHESEDFERHRFSQVSIPYDRPDVIYFDVKITAVYPADDETAEATRMEWLDRWMEQRRLCPAGHEVLERREFAYNEDNPARYDLRYEVQCASPPAG